uniref:Uncharacterized protein n=1 Tax=Sphaerodactylus townsendi TaxID=933632 RepID=A0ACB8FCS4_9SAUR
MRGNGAKISIAPVVVWPSGLSIGPDSNGVRFGSVRLSSREENLSPIGLPRCTGSCSVLWRGGGSDQEDPVGPKRLLSWQQARKTSPCGELGQASAVKSPAYLVAAAAKVPTRKWEAEKRLGAAGGLLPGAGGSEGRTAASQPQSAGKVPPQREWEAEAANRAGYPLPVPGERKPAAFDPATRQENLHREAGGGGGRASLVAPLPVGEEQKAEGSWSL